MTLLQRSSEAVEMTMDDTVIVVDPSTNQMLTLNKVGGLLWSALASPIDLDGLVQVCTAEFTSVDEARIRDDVAAFVEQAREAGVVLPAHA